MIVQSGALSLLTQQLAYLATCMMRLFTNNVTVSPTDTLATYTAAAWTGYLDVVLGTMTAAVLVGGKAQAQPMTPPTFTFTSSGSVTYYGWLVFDPSGTPTLIGAVNQGLQTLIAGQTVAEAGVITDTTG